MSLYLDLKYANLISPRLERFSRKNDYLFNFRCPICNDSKKNKLKARGYLFKKENGLFFRCHNCQASMSLGNLVKHIDNSLYNEYSFERYKNGENTSPNYKKSISKIPKIKLDKVEELKTFEHAEWCDKLQENHYAFQYLVNRLIPKKFFSKLLFTSDYKSFINTLYPKNEKHLLNEARIVIPIYDKYGELIGISGRALENASEKLRYVTIRLNDDKEKLIYGMDRADFSKRIYIVEGQFDSMFLSNSIASCDSNLEVTSKIINSSDKVLIFDNEPKNKEINNLQLKALKNGENVVIWPEHIKGKDINEMIKINGFSENDIKNIIDTNSYSGMEGISRFLFWKKI